jgi:hypothetical protein
LFLTLSKTLRNNVVLYNNSSLSLIKDDLMSMFKENEVFIQRYQNEGVEKNLSSNIGETEKIRHDQYSKGHVVGALSQMFMPVWTFHTNLYTSAFIDEEEMVDLNAKVSAFLSDILEILMARMKKTQSSYFDDFKVSSMFLCAEMIANVVHDYNGKLIKNRDNLDAYIKDPVDLLSDLVPAIYANFSALNKAAEGALSDIL